MREQTTRVKTGAVKKKILLVLGVVLAAALVVGFYFVRNPPYRPPTFEAFAVQGVPTPPDNMGYGEVSGQGSFSFSIVSTIYQQQDGSLLVYFTNPATSEANLMCEVTDPDGNTIYKSGVLRPGEYVERLQPIRTLPNEAMKVEMSVYAFEPDTWYSKGTISMANILQPY